MVGGSNGYPQTHIFSTQTATILLLRHFLTKKEDLMGVFSQDYSQSAHQARQLSLIKPQPTTESTTQRPVSLKP
jgi:hypothetical protein